MKTAGPRVSAVIVNFNRPDDTIECVRSLLASGYPDLTVLLIDNGSTDDSLAKLRRELPAVEVHETGRNLGFTGGNNFGFEKLRQDLPEYVLLLNNDTVVEEGFLAPLVAALEHDSTIAAAGGTVCYYPEKERVWYAGGRFTFWRGSAFAPAYRQPYDALPPDAVSGVTFITGCLMLLRSEALLQTGFLDDRFCMYLEDAELSLRLLRAGHRLVYVRGSRIYHKVHHAGNKPLPLYFSVRNRLLILDLYFSGWRRLVGTLYVLMTTSAKMILWWFARKDLFRAGAWGIEDYFKSNFGEGRGFTVHAT